MTEQLNSDSDSDIKEDSKDLDLLETDDLSDDLNLLGSLGEESISKPKNTEKDPETNTEKNTKEENTKKDVPKEQDQQTSTADKATDKIEKQEGTATQDTSTSDKKDNLSSRKDNTSSWNQKTGANKYERKGKPYISRRKYLNFNRTKITYTNIELLSRFISRTGKILPRRYTKINAKIQRKVAKEIKRARHLGLLPYTKR